MKYMTVREAAGKWGISERLVQKYCAQGRIDGAEKFGVSWRIPEDAAKPSDPRKTDKNAGQPEYTGLESSGFMPLMSTSFKPGKCLEYIENMADGPGKSMAIAEYYYFSGYPEKASSEAELYLVSSDIPIRLSACLIYAYANLSIGEIQKAQYALASLKEAAAKADSDGTGQLKAVSYFAASAAAVLLHMSPPEGLPPAKSYLPFLSEGVRLFAIYVQAHYLYLHNEYDKSLGMVEAAISMGAEAFPISAIYLHLVAVMDYMSLRRPEKAQEHLLSAWKLARPDDLIEGFGEHHGLLGGMLESVIKKDWPEDFKRIIAITYRFSDGWRKIHNPSTGNKVADNLTTTEFATAMLAARGWTNQEIGKHMNISPNTVKKYISIALQKLNISHRQDLKKYMLR